MLLGFHGFVFQYATAPDKNNVFHHLLQIRTLHCVLCNCVGSPKRCSKFGGVWAGVCGSLLVFIWAVRMACGVRDRRQTMSLTEQLVCLAKCFPSFRASCLRKKCRKTQLHSRLMSSSSACWEITERFE